MTVKQQFLKPTTGNYETIYINMKSLDNHTASEGSTFQTSFALFKNLVYFASDNSSAQDS